MTSDTHSSQSIGIQGLWAALRNILFVLLHIFVAITFLYVFLVAFPRIDGGSPAIPSMPVVNDFMIIVHALSAIPALLIGLITFNAFLRRRYLGVHKWLGKVYCWCIWISAITGTILATANGSGLIGQLGFGILGILWFWTTLIAYKTARKREIVAHRRWMIRSYALTLAVVTVRPLFWFGPAEGFDDMQWLAFCSWMCWVPNLILGEFYLRITDFKGALRLTKHP